MLALAIDLLREIPKEIKPRMTSKNKTVYMAISKLGLSMWISWKI